MPDDNPTVANTPSPPTSPDAIKPRQPPTSAAAKATPSKVVTGAKPGVRKDAAGNTITKN